MKGRNYVLRLAILAALAAFGCRDLLLNEGDQASRAEPKSQAQISATNRQPTTQTTFNISSGIKNIVRDKCHQCHHTAPYPAGVEIHAGSPWTMTAPNIQMVFDGVAKEAAPANRLISNNEKNAVLDWCIANGATGYTYNIPSTDSWSMDSHISGVSNGADAAGAGLFFGFAVEDLHRTENFKVQTYTDRNGVTKKGIEFEPNVAVDTDSFPSSMNPTHYLFIDGLEFGGRWQEMEFEGFVVQSRWAFIGFHTKEMKKGASPFAAREQRDYVRLQVDRDWVSWRGKKIPADGTETYPWAGADPYLTADTEGLNDGVFLNDDEWYHVQGSITDLGSTYKYYATVKTVGGTLKAEIAGTRPDNGTVYGFPFFGGYSTNGTGKKDRFAEWVFDVTKIHGSGGTSGGCRPPCELD